MTTYYTLDNTGSEINDALTKVVDGELASLDGDGQTLEDTTFQNYAETCVTPSSSSGALDLDLEEGNVFSVELTEDVTDLTFSNPPVSGLAGSCTLIATTGGYSITWPDSVLWADGTAPDQSTTVDIYTFITVDGGATWYGMSAGSAFA